MTKLRPLYYADPDALRSARQRRITFMAMSGLGKTHLSNMLRETGNWFHYSVDYRIGTRHLGEHIVDNCKREAMANPFLREMLMSDSIYIGSNITFHNLAPLSAYLGKPGDPAKGGISFDEYMRRQEQHRRAETASLIDTVAFIEKAREIYGYDHFVCDTGGSICEVVNPDDANDPVLAALAENSLIVWIKGSDAHVETLVERFDRAPKPMFTRASALIPRWERYLAETGLTEREVDPDAFIRWSYRDILADRRPLYGAIARNWGVTVEAEQLAGVDGEAALMSVIASALEAA